MSAKPNNPFGSFSAKQLGAWLRAERKALGKTQESVAEACQIRRQTVSDLENGKNVEIETLFAVLNHLQKGLRIVSYRVSLDEVEALFDEEVVAPAKLKGL